MSKSVKFGFKNGVRLSYAHLDKPYANANFKGQEPKYSATLLLPKTDKATYKALKTAVEELYEMEKHGKLEGLELDEVFDGLVGDGDGKTLRGKKRGDECKGMWVLNAKNSKQPKLLLQDGSEPIDVAEEFYSGCWAKVGVDLYAYNTSGNQGCGVGLSVVKKLKDDDNIGYTVDEKDYFDDDEDDL